VVGIGGAIIIGGLALVAWRLRKRNHARAYDNDAGLGGSSGSDKLQRGKSVKQGDTSYGTGPVNPAANF
jgi:hypothetical protein